MNKNNDAHGGSRPGAGRKPAALPTERLRVPSVHREVVVSLLERLKQAQSLEGLEPVEHLGKAIASNATALQMFPEISCGFASPAQDYIEAELSVDDLVVDHNHRQATFMVRAKGDSMAIGPAGIMDGYTLVVDRALTAKNGSIVIAIIQGNATCKRLFYKADGTPFLKADNPHYADRIFAEGEQIEEIWGVVRYCLHNLL